MDSDETESHSQKLWGCGKGITKINQSPAGRQEVKMRRKGEIAGNCDYVLSILTVIMNRKNNNRITCKALIFHC